MAKNVTFACDLVAEGVRRVCCCCLERREEPRERLGSHPSLPCGLKTDAHLFTPCLVDSDPHWFGCIGSGSQLVMRVWIQEHENVPILTNKPGFLPFKKDFVPSQVRYVFWTCYLLSTYFFNVKIQLFVTLSDQDTDPDTHWKQRRSTTLFTQKVP
jgi:hypothetical protein